MSQARAYLDAASTALDRVESGVVDTTGGFAPFVRLQSGLTALLSGDLAAARGWIRSRAKSRSLQWFLFARRLAAAMLPRAVAVASKCADRSESVAKSGFTERERAVLRLVRQGLKRDEIADRLGISVAAVKSQIRSSYATLGLTARRQAIKKLDVAMVL